MKILLTTPEIAPYSQCSDLAALAAALPKALRGLGHQTTVVSPLYANTDPNAHTLARRLSTVKVSLSGETLACAIYDGRTTGGVDVLFVAHECIGDAPSAQVSPKGRRIGLLLGQAAAELAATREPTCEIIHALGYQGALALPLAKARMEGVGTVLTLHDLERQGQFEQQEFAELALPDGIVQALSGQSPPNLLACGIRGAQRIIANSPGMADTLIRGETATKLCEAIQERKDGVLGIVDGVDAAFWNPLVDPHLTARFDPADTSGKDECKGALQYELGLPIRPDTPLVAVHGDLNAPLVAQTLTALLRNDVQIATATPGEPTEAMAKLVEEHDDQIKCVDASDDSAMHRLFGGADFLWTVSLGYPAGSLHLAAQRYGALPIVSAAGITGETVVDCDPHLETGTGFLYEDDEALLSALQRALSGYAQTDAFDALRRRAMRTDTSWERAARHYEHIYRSIV